MAQHKKWSREEMDFLKREYPSRETGEIMEALGRSKASIAKKASDLRVRKNKKKPKETDTMTPEKEKLITEMDETKRVKRHTAEKDYKCSSCGEIQKGSSFSFSNNRLERYTQCNCCRNEKNLKWKSKRIIEGRDW